MSLKIGGEVKIESEPCVIGWDEKLFVGCEDGSIKSFDASLAAGAAWPAHAVQLFALAAGGGRVYSVSNDGAIRVWSHTGEKLAELPVRGGDVGALRIFDNELYVGDEAGYVVVYENNEEKALFNVLEEVKDIELSRPFLFTVRDLDVTVTEIHPDDNKRRFTTRHTMEGRAPLRMAGGRLLSPARGGNNLQLIDVSVGSAFKKLHEVKVSDMIVTSLATSGDFVWTGGWDGSVRRWKIAGDKLEPAGEVDLGACIIGIVAPELNNVYAAVGGGRIVRLVNS